MTEGQLRLDPARALGGARDLTAAGKHLGAERACSGREIAAASARPPWGSDDIGAAFEKEYRPMEQKVLQVWQQLAAYVEYLGDAAARSVQENLSSDAAAGTRVRRPYEGR